MTFGANFVDWAKEMQYSGTLEISASSSESLLSIDNTKIYSFVCYGGPKSLFFITFAQADGSVLGSRYTSSIGWEGVLGGVINGDFLAVTPLWDNGNNLIIYNTITSEFKIKLFNGSRLQQIANEPNGVR